MRSFFLFAFTALLLGGLIFSIYPSLVGAQANPGGEEAIINPNLPLGGSGEEPDDSVGGVVSRIYRFAMLIAGLLAFGAIVYGAILRATAGGNSTQVGEANQWIKQALIGLVLLLGATYILGVINPDLTKLRPNPPIAPLGDPEDFSLEDVGGAGTYGCETPDGILKCDSSVSCAGIASACGRAKCIEIIDPETCGKK